MRVDVEAVSKAYGPVPAVVRATLHLDDGAWVGLYGPSGSGKTTLLRLIAGFEVPDAGRILLDGEVVSDRRLRVPPHLRQIGFVFQQPTLWPHMTVWQHLTFAARDAGSGMTARLEALLAATGLEDLRARHPAELSGGQARRVGLARALASEPRLLLLDEPFVNLDAAARDELLAVARADIARRRCSVLHVTHDLAEIAGDAGRLLAIEDGVLRG